LVVEYWGITRDLAAAGGFVVTPDCFGELICCADDLYVVDGASRVKLPGCFLVGLLGAPLRLEAPGVVRCVAARLRPWAVGRLREGDADPRRGWTDATDLFGSCLRLVTALLAARDWESLRTIIDEVLIEEVGRWQPGEADLVEPFLRDEPPPTEVVARERRTTTRRVERRVRALTGTSPKQLACLSRFQRARDALWADPSADLARLALEAGYSDQPHMTREFRKYSGQTPSRFAREMATRKRWLAANRVAFVQEPGSLGG
jgi:AraC-like DNA-binding protein